MLAMSPDEEGPVGVHLIPWKCALNSSPERCLLDLGFFGFQERPYGKNYPPHRVSERGGLVLRTVNSLI